MPCGRGALGQGRDPSHGVMGVVWARDEAVPRRTLLLALCLLGGGRRGLAKTESAIRFSGEKRLEKTRGGAVSEGAGGL